MELAENPTEYSAIPRSVRRMSFLDAILSTGGRLAASLRLGHSLRSLIGNVKTDGKIKLRRI